MRCKYRRDIHLTTGQSISVNCGNCFACKSQRKSQSVFRIDAHRRFSGAKHCYFVTLSYADDFLPYEYIKCDTRTGEILKDIQSDKPILNPNHIVNFFKRFRRYSGASVKYFYVGEYGDDSNTARPHWHIILHTDLSWRDCLDYVRNAWSISVLPSCRKGVYCRVGKYDTYRLSMGRVTVSSITMRRIRYCAKYVIKDCKGEHLVPKFARWSKKYGIDWLKSSEAKLTADNRRLYAFTTDGKPASLGRYFTHRIYTKDIYQRLIDDMIFAPDNWPPDCIIDSIAKQVAWHKKKEARENAEIGMARVRCFTPLIPL